MPAFVDMHCHALFGVDDGAKSLDEARAMVNASYADGVRVLCLTPHFRPDVFGDNRKASLDAFRILSDHVKANCPGMALRLGNELHYNRDCVSWLSEDLCRSVGRSRYVLVDFSARADKRVIMDGMWKMLGSGYIPILAHPERYERLSLGLSEIRELSSNGVLMQMDTQSPLGGFGLAVQMRAHAMLKAHKVNFMGSDAHDCKYRPPQMSEAYRLVSSRYGREFADEIFWGNALRLMRKIKNEEV